MALRKRNPWIKLFVTGWLHGSIRWQLTPEERSVWADLLALAGECSQDGRLCDNDGRALPRKYMASQFCVPATLLDRTIAKCIHEGRLSDDDDGVLTLVNWKSYQSEYDRQKKYRQGESNPF